MAKTRRVIGMQPVREALRAHPEQVHQVWLLASAPRVSGLARLAKDNGVALAEVSRAELDKLAAGGMHQGAVCDADPLRLLPSQAVLADPERLILALDGIQDPQNFGAVVRSAVGLGDALVLWGENSSAPLSAATFRASAGAVEHASLCRVPSLGQTLLEARTLGYQVLGLDAHGTSDLRTCELTAPTIIVLGGEGRGLSRGIRQACSQLVRLVAPQKIDSLNASVAAALALYEALSQRSTSGSAADRS